MKVRPVALRRFAIVFLAAVYLPAAVAATTAASLALGSSAAASPIGALDYIKGTVSLVRQGEAVPSPSPGDPLYDGDLLTTDASSSVSIAMDPSSGFGGTIVINPGTTFYLKRAIVEDQPKTRLDLMTGSLSAKVSKIAGTPTLGVLTGQSIFGVRGTEFEVALSLNASLLAICEEGQVAVSTDGSESPLPAGQAIQQTSGASFTPVSFDPTSIRDLRGRWLDDEGAAFRNAPIKALSVFEGIYTEHAGAILRETRALALDPVFRKWVEEKQNGVMPDPLDPTVLREKKEIAPELISLAKHFAVFERVWWRLRDMVEVVRSGEFSRMEIRKGLSVQDFVRTFDRESHDLERAIFAYRQALALYGERSPDSEDLIMMLATGGMD